MNLINPKVNSLTQNHPKRKLKNPSSSDNPRGHQNRKVKCPGSLVHRASKNYKRIHLKRKK